MASVGHIAVGMVAARAYHDGRAPRWSSMAMWSAVSMLPDADVIGFGFGVEYGDPWGHRGATHSLSFAIAVGLAIGFAARWFKRPVARTALVATVVLASHGLLDTLTDGGLGCALLWPFDLTRYFAPWRPIPVAPIGLAFLSPYGLVISLTELVLFSPLLVFALRSRAMSPRVVGVGLAVWLLSVWMIGSNDPIRQQMVGFVLREDTAYSSSFSEKAFRTIVPGQPDADVKRLLGPPYREDWFFDESGQSLESSTPDQMHGCWDVRFERGVVVRLAVLDVCRARGIERAMTLDSVRQRLGVPTAQCWHYSWSPSRAFYRLRVVCVSEAKVTDVIQQFFFFFFFFFFKKIISPYEFPPCPSRRF